MALSRGCSVTLIVWSIITAVVVACLAFEVVYDYQAKEKELVQDECVITKFRENTEYLGSSQANVDFNEIYTGIRKHVWLTGTYYVIYVSYCIPENATTPTAWCSEYRDGYYYESDEAKVFAKLQVGQGTVCWYEKDDMTMLTVTHDSHLVAQIVGVVFLTVIAFIALAIEVIFLGCAVLGSDPCS